MERRQEVIRKPHLELPWQSILCPVWLLQGVVEFQQKTGTGRGMSLVSLWRPVNLGQWEGKAGGHLETQDTRILHWADLTQCWGFLGIVGSRLGGGCWWEESWAMDPAWVPRPKGVN